MWVCFSRGARDGEVVVRIEKLCRRGRLSGPHYARHRALHLYPARTSAPRTPSAMPPAQWACAAWFSRHQTFQKWLMALIVLLAFSFAARFVYMALEPEWNLFDAMYFTFTIISTVGYGCMGPSTYASRAFTLFYVKACRYLLERSRPRSRRWSIIHTHTSSSASNCSVWRVTIRSIRPARSNSTREASRRSSSGAIAFYASSWPWRAGQRARLDDDFANSLAEPGRGKLYFFDALYFTVITSSTVGFGDICSSDLSHASSSSTLRASAWRSSASSSTNSRLSSRSVGASWSAQGSSTSRLWAPI